MNWKAAAILVFGQKNVRKTLAGALPLLVLTTTAETIRFDDIDRGPADVLQIGPVTVQDVAYDPGTHYQVATQAGVGLGVAFIGQPGFVDRTFTYAAGAVNFTGRINRVIGFTRGWGNRFNNVESIFFQQRT